MLTLVTRTSLILLHHFLTWGEDTGGDAAALGGPSKSSKAKAPRGFESIQKAFVNCNLGATLEEFTRMLSPVTLEQLRYCGTMLSERFGEPELAKEEAAHVLREIDGLIKETKESQMDEGARQYVLR